MHETSTRSPGTTLRDRGADLLDGADGLMPQDSTCLDLGDVALEDVQVGATDRDRVDPDDDVGVGLQLRVGDLLPAPLAGSVIDECVHGRLREGSW